MAKAKETKASDPPAKSESETAQSSDSSTWVLIATPSPKKAAKKTLPLTAKADIHQMIAIICQHKGIAIHEFIDPLLRPVVMVEYARVIRELNARLASER